MRQISVFVIYRNKDNKSERIEALTSNEAFEIYHDSKKAGYRARLFNQDGIQIAGIWR